MKTIIICLVIVLAGVPHGLGAADKAAVVAAELKALEGTWKIVRQEVNGKDMTSERLTVVIENDTCTFYRDGTTRVSSNRLTLDPAPNPKTMDMTITFGTGRGATSLAIYRVLADGQLEICKNDARGKKAATRPSEFTSKPGVGSGTVLHVLKRADKK